MKESVANNQIEFDTAINYYYKARSSNRVKRRLIRMGLIDLLEINYPCSKNKYFYSMNTISFPLLTKVLQFQFEILGCIKEHRDLFTNLMRLGF